jgi:colanic acid/amylovoran biosynthesis glycosyltransferase
MSERIKQPSLPPEPVPLTEGAGVVPAARQPTVAYLMSRFPKLTETFILYEMLAMAEQGVTVAIYPLLRERTDVMHPEAVPLVAQAHFHPFLSPALLRAHLHFLRRRPRAYLGALWALLRATWRSRRYFTRALALFPKAVYFAHQMAAGGVEHVHAHFASHPAAAAFVIQRLTGIRYSFTAHGSDIHRDQTMLRQKVAEAAFVVAISEYNRQVILEACGGQYGEKLLVIHCGVDSRLFEPEAESFSGTGQQAGAPYSLLCIGTLHEVKGQKVLVEACRLLKERHVKVACHFAGDGPDEAALVAQVREAGLADAVHFHGRLTRPEVIGLLHTADVVVAPSVPSRDGRREGIPVALIEAMAAGRPVVASRLSGIPELVKDMQTGLLTPPGDAAALADALECLYREPDLRRRLSQAGRNKVSAQFDLHQNAAVLAEYFKRRGSGDIKKSPNPQIPAVIQDIL